MPPKLKSIDHIHVYVANRDAARAWYQEFLGLTPVADLEFWAKDGGPLTLSDVDGTVHIALFESSPAKCRSTVALGVEASEFLAWKQHLSQKFGVAFRAEDHEVSWSLYFSDPDGNPYEVTTYDYAAVAEVLRTEA